MNKEISHFWTQTSTLYLTVVLPVAHLFLEGAGNQPAELAQAVVDSVTAPFLNDLMRDTTRFIVLYLHMTISCTGSLHFLKNYIAYI